MPALAPISGLPVFRNGLYLSTATARFFVAGTTTPKIVYADPLLGNPHTDPLPVTGYGNFPAIYVGEGFYDIEIRDGANALVQRYENIQGAVTVSEGGGGGGDVPEAQLLQTGDVIWRMQSGTRTGWARLNGRTVGSATSGATERANADAEDLFLYLWDALPDTIAAVAGGRGASAAGDWAANKQITLPTMQGILAAGLDDMGNTAAGRFAGTTFTTGTATSAGALLGAATHTLTLSEIPSHDHGGVTQSISGGLTYSQPNGTTITSSTANPQYTPTVLNATVTTSIDHVHPIAAVGGGALHNNVQPTRLGTFYIKL